jgi:hypothetical protein
VLYAIGADEARVLLEVAAKATSEREVVDATVDHDRDEAAWQALDKAWYGISCCLNHLVEELHAPRWQPTPTVACSGDGHSPTGRTGSSPFGSRPRCGPVYRS